MLRTWRNRGTSEATPPGWCSGSVLVLVFAGDWREAHAMNLLTVVRTAAIPGDRFLLLLLESAARRQGTNGNAVRWQLCAGGLPSLTFVASLALIPAVVGGGSAMQFSVTDVRVDLHAEHPLCDRGPGRHQFVAGGAGSTFLTPICVLISWRLHPEPRAQGVLRVFLLLLEVGADRGLLWRWTCSCSMCSGKCRWCRCTS